MKKGTFYKILAGVGILGVMATFYVMIIPAAIGVWGINKYER